MRSRQHPHTSTLMAILAASCVLTAPSRAPALTWSERGDAGQTCAAAQAATGSGTLSQISGVLPSIQDVDAYCIEITNPVEFSARIVGTSGFPYPVLYLFNSSCAGVTMSNFSGEGQAATITGRFVPAAGIYYLVVGPWESFPASSLGQIWIEGINSTEVQPNGTGATSPLVTWSTTAPSCCPNVRRDRSE